MATYAYCLHLNCITGVLCFSAISSKACSLLGLVPSIVVRDLTLQLTDAAQYYEKFLPSPELIDTELCRWKQRWQKCAAENRPSTCATAMKAIDSLEFPNIADLIRIVCTIPVSSCECERSASALLRLHTWSRASMSQERLSALAMLHVHYGHHIDLSEVVDKFSRKYPRRLELDNLLS